MWSFLPALPLRGLETPLVESFEYYLCRQVWATGYSVNELLRMTRRYCGRPFNPADRSWDNQQANSIHRIFAFERLAGVPHLRCGTLWWLTQAARVSMSLTRNARRWCPVCYEQWENDSSWEPQVWSVPAITNCPLHGCVLEDRCRNCGAPQRGQRNKEGRKRCSCCDRPLSGTGRYLEQPPFVRWVDRQVCELVRLCATPADKPLAFDSLHGFIDSLGKEAFAHEEVRLFVNGHRRINVGADFARPTIRTIINFCAMRGVGVEELLLRPSEASSAPLIDPLKDYEWIVHPTSDVDYRSEAICWLLKKLMSTCDQRYLPSIDHILKDIRTTRSVLREYNCQLYECYEERCRVQAAPAAMDRLARGFKIAANQLKETDPDLLKHHLQWRLPNKVASEANIPIEEASDVSWTAIVYARLLPRAKKHVEGLKRVVPLPVASIFAGLTFER